MPYHHGALRAALLEAAEAILEGEGRHELTLRAVARRVGVSHAAPKPHFGDLPGLLTALAASGFNDLRDHCEAALAIAPDTAGARLLAISQAYVAFARTHPGLFRLMLGSERLNWRSPELASASGAAFALLTQDDPSPEAPASGRDFDTLVTAITRLSLMHGLATLLVDGRVAPFVAEAPGGDVDALVRRVLDAIESLTRPA